jgi:hypothetical protein
MKTKLFSATLLIFFSASVIIYGCKKKKEEEAISTNADYAGTWSVNETCSSTWAYSMTAAATGSNGITFTNFHKGTQASGFTITATVSDKTITIPSQSATSTAQGGPYTFSGSGTFTPPSSLSITYSMRDTGGNTISCTATCTK